ncbi:hypothetical protein BC831DRAFT_493461, partial [Entophlyctis helioformis]
CRILSVLVSIRLSFLAVCMSMTAESTCMASEISSLILARRLLYPAIWASTSALLAPVTILYQLPVVLVPASMYS